MLGFELADLVIVPALELGAVVSEADLFGGGGFYVGPKIGWHSFALI
jgi:hypothetical protein